VPSLYEGFSLPAVEAMACGVPVVATTGGALPEVVGTDGETGLLVPPGDPSSLAVALGRILDDPDLARRLSVAGRHRVLQRFTWRACAEATVEQYRWALERDQGQRRAGVFGGRAEATGPQRRSAQPGGVSAGDSAGGSAGDTAEC
jgi:glycogen synthase